MYKELYIFSRSFARRKAVWTDGELWTAVACGIGFGFFTFFSPETADGLRDHFSELLTLLGLFFGFALASLALYFGFLPSSSKLDPNTIRDSQAIRQLLLRRVVEGYIQTIFTLLLCIGWVILVWAFGENNRPSNRHLAFQYGVLSFLIIYPICQIINHATTIWWTVTKSPFSHDQISRTATTTTSGDNVDLEISQYEKTFIPSLIGTCYFALSIIFTLSFNLSWVAWVFLPAGIFVVSQCLVFCAVGLIGIFTAYKEKQGNDAEAGNNALDEQ